MVDVAGHLAFGLLFALPAWVLWNRRASVAFVGLSVFMSMLPDVDLYLSKWFPSVFTHHGITHTVVFVVVVGVLSGVVVAGLFGRKIDGWTRGERFDHASMTLFVAGAFTLGGLGHLFADMLSAPDIAAPVEPFYPFFDKPWAVDVFWYNNPWVNEVFFVVMVLVHLGIAATAHPFDHRFRIEDER